MAVHFGAGGQDPIDGMYRDVVGVWQRITVGVTVILVVVMAPLITAWLGPGHDQAALFAAVLTVAYGCNMLTGPAVSYLRAVGRPGTEGAYGVLTVLVNLVFTLALGIAFGAIGVVGATLAAYLVSTAWFFRRAASLTPRAPRDPAAVYARWGLASLLAGAVAYGIAQASASLLPTGVALIGVALAIVAALGVLFVSALGPAYAASVTRRLAAALGALTGRA